MNGKVKRLDNVISSTSAHQPDNCIWLERYDFLLVFYGNLIALDGARIALQAVTVDRKINKHYLLIKQQHQDLKKTPRGVLKIK